MPALAERKARNSPVGSPLPRVSPPRPLKAEVEGFRKTASEMGIELMPWQETAARYQTARGPDGRHLYREIAVVVARQNGKTTLMKPVIIRALREGKRIMHIAQNRELPRQMFGVIADALASEPDLFPKRRGKTIWPRYGAGQEEIVLANEASYRIAAAGTGGARGWALDLVIIDELREMRDFEVIGAVEPTLTMSKDPQIIYLSNAGSGESVVLNAVRDRAGKDPSLAYLEWSAAPDLAADDINAWISANPAIGHYPAVLDTLERAYLRHQLADTMSIFETEHLCRWVPSIEERLVTEQEWAAQTFGSVGSPQRAVMGISVDTDHERASVVIAWADADGSICLDVHDTRVSGQSIEALSKDIVRLGRINRVWETYFDPYTDADLARFIPRAQALRGQQYVAATHTFVRLVNERKFKVQDPAGVLTEDLKWTSRRHGVSNSYMAVRANDEHSNTAALAAIRAALRASDPTMAAARQARIS